MLHFDHHRQVEAVRGTDRFRARVRCGTARFLPRPVAASGGIVLVLGFCISASATGLEFNEPVALYGGGPLLRLLGTPPLEMPPPAASGKLQYRLSLDVVNHADRSAAAGESMELDGESYYLHAGFRKRLSDRLTLGLDVPLVSHSSGTLDNLIDSWHDIFGLSNARRAGTPNQLAISYIDQGQKLVDLRRPRTGIGDIRASAYWQLTKADDAGPAFGFAAYVELPTGDSEHLLGNSATDISAGVYLANARLSPEGTVALSSAAGITRPGSGDLLEHRRKTSIAYAGLDLSWRAASRWQLHAAVYGQTAGFKSELDELGRGSVQLALAARFKLSPESSQTLEFVVIEDVISDSTPDFGIQMTLRGYR